jgi:membrane fusion protein, macrolide-specific efflux system
MKRYLWLSLAFAVFLGVNLLSGCGLIPPEEELKEIAVVQSKETLDYNMDMVRRGDILSTMAISCSYLQLNEEYLYFLEDGKKVKNIYVNTGDKVEKGELLAELDTGDLDEEIEDLSYTLEKYQLEYNQLLETKQFDLDCADEMYYYTYMTSDDREDTKEAKEDIEASYKEDLEDYQDNIYLTTQQLNQDQKEKTQSCVYAGMAGVVSFLRANLEGSISSTENEIIKIADDSQCSFFSEDISSANLEGSISSTENEIIKIADDSQCSFFSEDISSKDFITEGQVFTLTLGSGSKISELEVKAVNVAQWTDKMQFDVVDDTSEVDFGTKGTIELVLGGKKDVLYIPVSALHKADDKYYVYTTDEDGMREVKYISVGLIGNDSVEVTKGLEEGEIVILR